jgi:diguanylate cyclase (GGDEF)-like protein
MMKSNLSIIIMIVFIFACISLKANVLVFGGDRDYPPYEYIDENGDYTGFNVDIMRAVARVLGMDLEIELGEWNYIVEKMKSGQLDGLLGMAVTAEREKLYSFSIPHNYLYMSIFYRKNTSISSVEELRDKEIIVQKNGVMHDYLLENSITDKIITVEVPLDGLKMLSSGKGDFGLFGKYQGLYLAKQNNLKNLAVFENAVFERDYCFAVSKENQDLLGLLNKGLLFIRDSGEYREIYKKWFGTLDWFEGNVQNIVFWGTIVILLFLIVVFVLSIWNSTLKKLVEKRTEELTSRISEYDSLQNKIRALHEVTLQMEKCSDEEEVYDLVVKAAREILKYDYYSLDIVEGDFLVAKRYSDTIEINSNVPKYEGIAGRTLKTGETIVVDDITSVDYALPSSSKIRSLLSIPMGSFGVFQTVSLKLAAFSREDVELAELLIYHAVGAIDIIRKTKEISFLAFHDSLTGLYNRTFFDEEILRMDTSRNLPISLIFGDVNGLKIINDSYGHFYGDEYLKTVAGTIKSSCRQEDLVVRWGGDEFVVLLFRTSEQQAREIIFRIESNLVAIRDFPVTVSVSFGVSTKTSKDQNIANLIEEAEFEMYNQKGLSKKSGKTMK